MAVLQHNDLEPTAFKCNANGLLEPVVKETVTTIVDNGNGTVTHTSEDGTVTTFSVGGGVTVNDTPIAFVPTASGNATNLGEVVTDPDGNVWIIDGNGDAVMVECNQGFKIDTANLTTAAPSVNPDKKTLHQTTYFPSVNAMGNNQTAFIEMTVTNPSLVLPMRVTFIANHHVAWFPVTATNVNALSNTFPTRLLLNGTQIDGQSAAAIYGGTGSWNCSQPLYYDGTNTPRQVTSVDVGQGANYATTTIAPGGSATIRVEGTALVSPAVNVAYWQDLSITAIGNNI